MNAAVMGYIASISDVFHDATYICMLGLFANLPLRPQHTKRPSKASRKSTIGIHSMLVGRSIIPRGKAGTAQETQWRILIEVTRLYGSVG